MTVQLRRPERNSRLACLTLSVSLLGAVACQSLTGTKPNTSTFLSLDAGQLSRREQSEIGVGPSAKIKTAVLREQLKEEQSQLQDRQNQISKIASINSNAVSPQSPTTIINQASVDGEDHNSDEEDSDDDSDIAALVEENEKDADKEILDADSARSPEEVAELLQYTGIEGHFALCEGSIYMQEWQRIFENQFISQSKNRFKKTSHLKKALEDARSEEYTKLLLPALSNFDFDYPVIINEDVIKWIQYFQTRGRKAFVTWLRRAEDVIPQAVPVLEKFGLPADLIYLAMIESGFNNKATSSARAAGTWQFMRATGRNFGLKLNDYVDERRDPEKASVAAAKYLTYLYTLFGDWHLATASYNAGEGRVSRAMRGQAESSFFALSKARRLPNETRNYVPKLMAAMIISKNPSRFGFDVAEGSRALRTSGLALTKSVRVSDVAAAAGVDLKVLENINPELRLGVTPPGTDDAPYILRVPESAYATAFAAVDSLPQATRSYQVTARVKRRETVHQFARRYGISLATLLNANPNIRANARLSKGQSVMIPVALGSGQYERLTYEDKSPRKKNRAIAKKSRAAKLKIASRAGSKARR